MKKINITEYLIDFVSDYDYKNGDNIIVEIEGRNICTAEVKIRDESIEFKVKPLFR